MYYYVVRKRTITYRLRDVSVYSGSVEQLKVC